MKYLESPMTSPKRTFVLSTTFAVSREKSDAFLTALKEEFKIVKTHIFISKVHQEDQNDCAFNVQLNFDSLSSLEQWNEKHFGGILIGLNKEFSSQYASFQTLLEEV